MTRNTLKSDGEGAVTVRPSMVPDISRLPLSYCLAQHSLHLRSYLKQSTDVVRQRHQRPFGFHFPHATQSEAVKPAGGFNVSQHRFHDRFAATVPLPPDFGAQLALHALLDRTLVRNSPTRGRLESLRVLGFPDGDVEVDAPDRLGGDVRFTKVARIGRQAARPTPGRLFNRGHPRHQGTSVRRLRGHIGRDNELVRGIDGRLRIVALDERAVSVPHATRLGIRKVVLRFVRWGFAGRFGRTAGGPRGLLAVPRPLGLGARFGLGFPRRFGLAGLPQAIFPAAQLGGQLVSSLVSAIPPILLRVDGRRLLQHRRHLRPPPVFVPPYPPMTPPLYVARVSP